MTIHPRQDQLLPNGEVRIADLLVSLAMLIEEATAPKPAAGFGEPDWRARLSECRRIAARMRYLAETIEKGK